MNSFLENVFVDPLIDVHTRVRTSQIGEADYLL